MVKRLNSYRYGNRLVKFLICMIVPLIKKLRSIFSNKEHCLKQAFQERTLPKINQQPVSEILLVSQQQPQNLFH